MTASGFKMSKKSLRQCVLLIWLQIQQNNWIIKNEFKIFSLLKETIGLDLIEYSKKKIKNSETKGQCTFEYVKTMEKQW